MYIYEVINPSDAITFMAPDDKIAFACCLIIGRGKLGCNREGGTSLPTLMMFMKEEAVEAAIMEQLGTDLGTFIRDNRKQIADCFDTFAYVTIGERKIYNSAIEAITDPEKLKEFKTKHEDENRSSMSKWVLGAWNYAQQLYEKLEKEEA